MDVNLSNASLVFISVTFATMVSHSFSLCIYDKRFPICIWQDRCNCKAGSILALDVIVWYMEVTFLIVGALTCNLAFIIWTYWTEHCLMILNYKKIGPCYSITAWVPSGLHFSPCCYVILHPVAVHYFLLFDCMCINILSLFWLLLNYIWGRGLGKEDWMT